MPQPAPAPSVDHAGVAGVVGGGNTLAETLIEVESIEPGRRSSPRHRARRAVAAVLAVAFAVLLPVAVTGGWIRGTLLSTDGYVAAVTPVAASPVIRAAVQSAVTSEADALLQEAVRSLPPPASSLAGPLSGDLAKLAADATSRFMASTTFRSLWVAANRSAHRQVVSVLNGDGTKEVSGSRGSVAVNLVPLINDVLGQVGQLLSKAAGRTIKVPPVTSVPAAACARLTGAARPRLSADCGQFSLFPASALTGPKRAYQLLGTVTFLLLALVPLAGAGALLAAPRRRRVLLPMAIGAAATLLAARIGQSWLQSSVLGRAGPADRAPAGVIVHALTSGLFRLEGWFLIGCVVVAAATLASGPGWRAVVRYRRPGRLSVTAPSARSR
jgi:hypothetical protein